MAQIRCEVCNKKIRKGMRICAECSEEVCVVANRYDLDFAAGVQKLIDIRATSEMVSQMNSRQIRRGR